MGVAVGVGVGVRVRDGVLIGVGGSVVAVCVGVWVGVGGSGVLINVDGSEVAVGVATGAADLHADNTNRTDKSKTRIFVFIIFHLEVLLMRVSRQDSIGYRQIIGEQVTLEGD